MSGRSSCCWLLSRAGTGDQSSPVSTLNLPATPSLVTVLALDGGGALLRSGWEERAGSPGPLPAHLPGQSICMGRGEGAGL